MHFDSTSLKLPLIHFLSQLGKMIVWPKIFREMFVCKWWWHLLLPLRRKWTSYQDTDTWTNILSWRSRFKNDLSLTILEENSKVIIHTSDTDVLVIALGCLEHIPESINLWLEVGLYAKKSQIHWRKEAFQQTQEKFI